MSSFLLFKRILGLFKHIAHQKLAFLRNLPLEMHNFIIFVDKLYIQTDYNDWFAIFWPLKTRFFCALLTILALNSALD